MSTVVGAGWRCGGPERGIQAGIQEGIQEGGLGGGLHAGLSGFWGLPWTKLSYRVVVRVEGNWQAGKRGPLQFFQGMWEE